MKELKGKTAVVTGGGSGIGRGMALGFAAEGMSVAILDINEERGQSVAAELSRNGAHAVAWQVDVTSADDLGRVAAEVAERLGGVHVLCANAGVMLPLGPMSEKSPADWEYVFSVNLHGVVKTVNAFLPYLRAAGEAHIVNTASLGGVVAVPQFPIGVYVASKYACVGYSECLRGELEADGIGVSVLCPGVVESDLYNTSAQQRPARFGGPEEIAAIPSGAAPTAMPAEEVGPIVVRAIRENRLHIFTHPQALPVVEQRFAVIRGDFEAEAQVSGGRGES